MTPLSCQVDIDFENLSHSKTSGCVPQRSEVLFRNDGHVAFRGRWFSFCDLHTDPEKHRSFYKQIQDLLIGPTSQALDVHGNSQDVATTALRSRRFDGHRDGHRRLLIGASLAATASFCNIIAAAVGSLNGERSDLLLNKSVEDRAGEQFM